MTFCVPLKSFTKKMKRSLAYSSPYGELMAPLFYESLVVQLFLPKVFFCIISSSSGSNSQRVTKSEKSVVIVSLVAFKKTQMHLRLELSKK